MPKDKTNRGRVTPTLRRSSRLSKDHNSIKTTTQKNGEQAHPITKRHSRSSEHKRPLRITIKTNDMVEIQTILASSTFDVNKIDEFGRTPIYYAAEYNKIEIAKLLIENGADVGFADRNECLIFNAVYDGDVEMVELLLSSGARASHTFGKYGSLLHIAAEFNFVEIVDLLIGYGADISYRDERSGNFTPFHSAIFERNFDLAKEKLFNQELIWDVRSEEANRALVKWLDEEGHVEIKNWLTDKMKKKD